MAQPVHASKLYERDFVAWCEETVAKLKAHDYLMNVFDDAWQDALKQVHRDYAKELFPEQWPLSRDIDALLDNQFWLADEDL
jgi:hypothetical protein